MMRLFLTEFQKMRRRHIGLIYAAAFCITLTWLLWAMNRMEGQLAHQCYYYLLGGIPLMNAIFLPTVLACAESRLCDMELKGNALKLLCTMQPRHSLFHVKLIISLFYLLLFTLAEVALMPVLCRLFHATQQMPADLMAVFFLSTFTVGGVLILLQETLSLLSDNQLFPLFFGIGGTFVGIFSWFFPDFPLRYLLHYIEDLEQVFRNVWRTLRSGGTFLFNIEHPVFTSGVHQDWIYREDGTPKYWPVDDYYRPGQRGTRFLGCEVIKQHHTLTQILMGLINCGFTLEVVEEVQPSAEMLEIPGMKDEMRRPMMLLVRTKKERPG